MLKSPGAIAFNIGSIPVYWYGIIIAFAFLIGLFLTLYIAKKDYPEDKTCEHIIDLSTLLLIGGVVFARIYYVIFNWDYYSLHLSEIFMTWRGGLSIHGVIIGSILIIYFYAKKHKLSLLKYTDQFVYGMILAQAIGRWGNFINSQAFGFPTNLFWKLYIPPENRPAEYINFEYFHPTFLYESIWNIAVFIILITIVRKNFKEKTGSITCFYFILYSLGRFIIESFRIDNIYVVLGLHIAQFVSIIIFIVGITGLYLVLKNKSVIKT